MTTYFSYRYNQRLSLLGKLFIAIMLIAVFEGAARKWISNGLTYPLVGLRDGLAVCGVLWASAKRGIRRKSPFVFLSLTVLSTLLVLWGAIQLMINETSPLVYFLGLRFWLLYLWFAVLSGTAMSQHDFNVISKVIVLLLIGMTPLVVVQHFLPPTSFWNKQLDEDSFIFRVAGDIVRVTGTFSFTMGYTVFLAVASPFMLIAIDSGYKFWRSKWISIIVLPSLLAATIVSGSRGAIIFFAELFAIYSILSVLFVKGKQKGKSIGMMVLILILTIASSWVFSRAVDATKTRFEVAQQSETFSDRLEYMLLPRGEISFFGAGIGMGSNFASVFEKGSRSFQLAESENARIVLELGMLGFVILIIKLVVIFGAGWQSFLLAKRFGNISTMLIWTSVALALLTWPITGQLTVNVMGYLLFGLGIAALGITKKRLIACK